MGGVAPPGAVTSPPRLVLFGSGSPLSRLALEGLASRFAVIALVVPDVAPAPGLRGRMRAAMRWAARRGLVRDARRRRIPVWRFDRRTPDDVAERLAAAGPDLACVASFPYRLPGSVRRSTAHGVLNVHPSLLPRHRGPDPLFWTYHADDREAGISVHWMDEGLDTGPIVFQEAVPLGRGRPVAELYHDLAGRGARLLGQAVDAVARGAAPAVPQDESRATREPAPAPGAWRIDFESWSAERLWHFVAGLAGRYPFALHDAAGAEIAHGPALGFTLGSHGRHPGSVERAAGGWRVYCRDGVVDVAGPGPAARLRALARARAR
jgi:methionyl-tRNA formyltransferase